MILNDIQKLITEQTPPKELSKTRKIIGKHAGKIGLGVAGAALYFGRKLGSGEYGDNKQRLAKDISDNSEKLFDQAKTKAKTGIELASKETSKIIKKIKEKKDDIK
jgi:hypothetical protein